MDKKIFYLCDFNKGWNEKKKKIKKGTSSEVSKKSTESCQNIKTAFSMRDIQNLNTKDLASKVFSMNEELTKAGVRPDDIKNVAFTDDIIANLACMRDIDR